MKKPVLLCSPPLPLWPSGVSAVAEGTFSVHTTSTHLELLPQGFLKLRWFTLPLHWQPEEQGV